MGFMNLFRKKREEEPGDKFSLYNTFGCHERPEVNCPTFLVRNIHKDFENALKSYNIIVVYGESRQGKTWTIERYCPSQLRIGCEAIMEIKDLKIAMLHAVGLDVRKIDHSITEEYQESMDSVCRVGGEMLVAAGANSEKLKGYKETLSTSYETVDLSRNIDFYEALKINGIGKYFVFDNFHYLDPSVQQKFCTLLKEFNYHGIKIIIVGVWKDASKITALAPDLVNRCVHLDIGSWSDEELNEIVELGSKALNIEIAEDAVEIFKSCSANNIGIFKDFLQKYCQEFNISETVPSRQVLSDETKTQRVVNAIITEAYTPLRDRINNLAVPHRDRRDSKFLRLKIIIVVLRFIIEREPSESRRGIEFTTLRDNLQKLSLKWGEPEIAVSNLTQELGKLHEREENRQTGGNFIPLFYYDKTNKKLLILEPTIYAIKAYDSKLLQDIANDLEKNITGNPNEVQETFWNSIS